jgi:hypothetical protein
VRRVVALAGAAAVTLVVLGGGPQAALLTLAPADEEEAMRLGERSITSDVFGAEWRVANDAGESVTVVTPFHRLALAARHAAFKNEPLKPQDRERMLRDLRDRLMLWVNVLGPREDFARYLVPRLVAGDEEIAPVMVQNERTAIPRDDGRYMARNVYWFPTQALTAGARPTLVVRNPDGQIVARFSIDLGKMR